MPCEQVHAPWKPQSKAQEIPDYPVAYDAGKALNAAAKAAGEEGFGTSGPGKVHRLLARCPRECSSRNFTQNSNAHSPVRSLRMRTIPSRADRLVGFEHAGRRQASRR